VQTLADLLDRFQEWRDNLPSSLANSAAAEALDDCKRLHLSAPLQRPTRTGGQIQMASPHLVENRNRPQLLCRRQHRHNLCIKELGQRIGAASPSDFRPRRWKPVILPEPICGRRADRSLCGAHRRAVYLSEGHVEPHLVICDMGGRAMAGHS
jgi:hypothetical protein